MFSCGCDPGENCGVGFIQISPALPLFSLGSTRFNSQSMAASAYLFRLLTAAHLPERETSEKQSSTTRHYEDLRSSTKLLEVHCSSQWIQDVLVKTCDSTNCFILHISAYYASCDALSTVQSCPMVFKSQEVA